MSALHDVNDKINNLGVTLKTQFNHMAIADLTEPAELLRLRELSARALELQTELAENFALPITTPTETLAAILAEAEKRGIADTANLNEALAQLNTMKTLLPENACPTVNALQDAARQAIGLPRP
jgi:hypothetical protein